MVVVRDDLPVAVDRLENGIAGVGPTVVTRPDRSQQVAVEWCAVEREPGGVRSPAAQRLEHGDEVRSDVHVVALSQETHNPAHRLRLLSHRQTGSFQSRCQVPTPVSFARR